MWIINAPEKIAFTFCAEAHLYVVFKGWKGIEASCQNLSQCSLLRRNVIVEVYKSHTTAAFLHQPTEEAGGSLSERSEFALYFINLNVLSCCNGNNSNYNCTLALFKQ